jgi:hypothetical protein
VRVCVCSSHMGNLCPSDQQKGSFNRKIDDEDNKKQKRNDGGYIKLEGDAPKINDIPQSPK